MNASIQERLAQRRKGREERRQRVQDEHKSQDDQDVFFAAFGNSNPSSITNNGTRRPGLVKSTSAGHLFSLGNSMHSTAGTQRQPKGQMDTSTRSSINSATAAATASLSRQSMHSLKPPPKDTRTYNNNAIAPTATASEAAPNRLSLAPPTKDTRPYSNDDTVITTAANNNVIVQDARLGREPKRGNLQRHRSRSLTDLQRYTGGGKPLLGPVAPKTPKLTRASFAMATPRTSRKGMEKRISVKSLQIIAPTIIQPQEVQLLVSPQPKKQPMKRRVSNPKFTELSSSKSSLESFNNETTTSTTAAAATSNGSFPRMDPLASPLSKRASTSTARKRISGGSAAASSKRPSASKTAKSSADITPSGHRANRKPSSRQLLVDGNEDPVTPRRSLRSRGEHSLTPTAPSVTPIRRPSKMTHKAMAKKPVSPIKRSKSVNDGELVLIDDDDDDDDDLLFTPHRTPMNKGSTRQLVTNDEAKQKQEAFNRINSFPLTSQSEHGNNSTVTSSSNNSTSPIKTADPATSSRWSMANPDQVTKWKSKLATTATPSTTASITSCKGSAVNLTPPRQRRRYSMGNETSTSIGRAPSLEMDEWVGTIGDRASENNKLGDGYEFQDDESDTEVAPPPLMDMTREEQRKTKNGSNNIRNSLRSSKAQSMMDLIPATRNSLDKCNNMLNFQAMAIMDDNARNDVARPRSSGASRKGLDAERLPLFAIESNESRASVNHGSISQETGRPRSRSTGSRHVKSEGQSLQHTEHRRKSKDKSQLINNEEEPRTRERSFTRGNLQRHRSRSLSDLQAAAIVEGPKMASAAPNNSAERRDTFHGQPRLQGSDSSTKKGVRKIKSADPTLVAPKTKCQKEQANQALVNSSGSELSPDSGNKNVRRPPSRKGNSSDGKVVLKKKRESTRRRASKGNASDTKRTSVTDGEASKSELERGRADRNKPDDTKQHRVRGSKSPKESSRLGRRGVGRTRSSSLSDLRAPRLDAKKLLSPDHINGNGELFEQSTMTMNDSIPTIGGSSFGDVSHPGLTSPEGNAKHCGPRKQMTQTLVSSCNSSQRKELEESATMNYSAASLGNSSVGQLGAASPMLRKNLRGPRKQKLQRSRTEECTRAASPARHPRPRASLLPERPSLARHRSNSLSDLRASALSVRKSQGRGSRRLSAFDADEEEKDIAQLNAEIEKLKDDLKNAAHMPPRSFEDERKYLEEANKKEQADQKSMRGEMFDMYHDNVKLEEALEKTQQYYLELEDIHNAEAMKNEALLKNVPVFKKVIEAHEFKLARRARYIDFECRTMQFYEDRIQTIIQSFREKCTDAKLVKTLEKMSRSTAPLIDENDTVNTGTTSVGSTASPPQQVENSSQGSRK
jgi:hypothetical protein